MYPVNTTKSYFLKFPESYLATFFCRLSWKENDDCLLNCKCGVSSKILCISDCYTDGKDGNWLMEKDR